MENEILKEQFMKLLLMGYVKKELFVRPNTLYFIHKDHLHRFSPNNFISLTWHISDYIFRNGVWIKQRAQIPKLTKTEKLLYENS